MKAYGKEKKFNLEPTKNIKWSLIIQHQLIMANIIIVLTRNLCHNNYPLHCQYQHLIYKTLSITTF
jgi:hypothetical protein